MTIPLESQIDYNGLLDGCKRGDPVARELLFEQLRVRLRPILKYRLRGWPTEELEDILQDSLTVVFEKLDQVESNPDRFALEVLRKKIGNSLMRHRRVTEVSMDSSDDRDDRDENKAAANRVALQDQDDNIAVLESEDIASAIRRAIRHLSPLCQLMLTALLENLSVAETWELMRTAQGNLQRSTFDKRLFDCRKRLRQLLAHKL
jgi:hypothetical protein